MCRQAEAFYLDVLQAEMHRRAVHGVLEPVIGGKDREIIGAVRKYSDNLLMALARKADPAGFGNKIEADVKVSGGVVVIPASIPIEGGPLKVERVEDDKA